MLSLCSSLWWRMVVLQVKKEGLCYMSYYFCCSCFESNLNGEYFSNPQSNGYYRGIIWELWLGDYSLKETRMMIRRKRDP